MDADQSLELQGAVLATREQRRSLTITGHGSKAFYGRSVVGDQLSLAGHRGVVNYEPTELVISARAGTPLEEIEGLLTRHGQMLAFEPPRFNGAGTLGGAIASGLSGPRRPYTGSARDFVLGTRLINGRGEILRFGGEVMKNVAGFDVSRLMAGSLGTLGVLLEISLKVLPLPETERTLVFDCNRTTAIEWMNTWAGQALPLSAAAHFDGQLWVRLSGNAAGVSAGCKRLGGSTGEDGFWQALRNQTLNFFTGDIALWRLSLPPATPPHELPGDCLIDWGGAQRWLRSAADADQIRAVAAAVGGHATLFRGATNDTEVFHPLQPALMAMQQRLKQSFDPDGLFNPGRLYRDL